MKAKNLKRVLLALLFAGAVALIGCEGDDGDDGAPGASGAPGAPGTTLVDVGTSSPEALAELTVSAEITSATPQVVNFTVVDNFGRGVLGLDALRAEGDLAYTRFNIAKLVAATPVSGDPDSWVNYIRSSTSTPVGEPATERNGTLVDHGDGTYTYTFKTDVTNVTTPVVVTYQPTLTHRVAIQISGVGFNPVNPTFDFVPAGGAVTTRRDIAMTASCNECHGVLAEHGGNRIEVKYCVTCHNPDLVVGVDSLTMPTLVHKIHSANSTYLDSEFAEVTFPTPEFNCLKCHNGADAATPQGNNWQNRPHMDACGGCHVINFGTPVGDPDFDHPGGPQANNAGCKGCHPPDAIEGYHISDNATPNNPKVPAGAVNFTYEISGVTVNASNQPVVVFRILADGTPVTFGAPGTTLLSGFSGSPGFLVAYALPQEGITTPADYNNRGKSAAQPASVTITNVWNGTQGTLAGPDQSGFYTATLNGTADAARFPAGATMRAIGLQAYFTQLAGTNGIEANTSRHTPSVVKAVTGDAARRQVVDNNKCFNCHEWFEGHGGSRTFNIEICTLCHQPNMSSSGRAIDPAKAADRDGDPLTTDPSAATVDLGTSDTSTWPEDTNNLKDMIHGIHSSGFRTFDYEFVRGRNDGIYYNWAEVTFPNNVGNCKVCHIDGTWELPLDSNTLNTTVRTTGAADGMDADHLAVIAARASVPNLTDWVNTPTASACYYCHTDPLVVAHMRQNGGIISVADPAAGDFVQRQDVNTVESCAVCHGPGGQADLEVVHGLK
jgi:OmcA/MtrC family decaheme c-type cytochrome